MLLQGFATDTDSLPCSLVVISENKENMNHNNLKNRNATIKIYRNHF